MKELDKENLQKLNKTVVALVLLEIYSIPLYIILFLNPSPETTNLIFLISIALMTVVSAITFILLMRRSSFSIRKYLHIEGRFLVNELPSIIQIITVLSFLSFYLAKSTSRAILTIAVILLLYVYLRVRRMDYLGINLKGILSELPRAAVEHLHIVISVILGSIVYIIAANLAHIT